MKKYNKHISKQNLEKQVKALQEENKKLQSDRTVKISFLEAENKRLAAEVKQVKCASNNAVLKDLWNLKEELREANYQKNIWKTNCQKKVEENRELKAHEKSIYKYIEENKKLKKDLSVLLAEFLRFSRKIERETEQWFLPENLVKKFLQQKEKKEL